MLDYCYRSPDQGEETYLKQLKKVSDHRFWLPWRKLPDTCCRGNKEENKQATRFLTVLGNKLLLPVSDEPMRGDAHLDLL